MLNLALRMKKMAIKLKQMVASVSTPGSQIGCIHACSIRYTQAGLHTRPIQGPHVVHTESIYKQETALHHLWDGGPSAVCRSVKSHPCGPKWRWLYIHSRRGRRGQKRHSADTSSCDTGAYLETQLVVSCMTDKLI